MPKAESPLPPMSVYDCSSIRAALPFLSDHTYLNTGTEGLLAEPVLAEYLAAISRQEREGHAALEWRHAELERTRQAVADLLHAHADTITFSRNASDGHNIVLQGLDWQPGDELLISDQEHPALSHPAAYLQDKRGVKVRVFRIEADPLVTLRNIGTALSPKSRLIAFSHVSCESGIRLPAKRICQLAREHGAMSLLDGAQSLGAVPVDVQELACDFFVSNGHKWLCGPKGTGILYVRRDRLGALNLSGVGAGTFAHFSWSGTEFSFGLQPNARRFEFGTRNHAALVGLRAALSWLHDLGFSNVYRHIGDLANNAHRILAEIPGVDVITPRSADKLAGIITFNVPGRNPAEIAQELRRQGIITRHTTTPPGVRTSAAYFNTEQDFVRLAAALRSLI